MTELRIVKNETSNGGLVGVIDGQTYIGRGAPNARTIVREFRMLYPTEKEVTIIDESTAD